MNRKWLVSVMSVIMLAAVYIASNVMLPQIPQIKAEDTSEYSKIISVDLTSRKVVIDSGHGGIDPGKESSGGILEKDINLAIAQKLKVMLEEAQIEVVMTRSDDGGLYEESDNNKKIADMKKRCDIIEKSNADMVISIHQNSFQSGLVKGAQVFYYKYSEDGKKLAQTLQQQLIDSLDNDNKRVAKADNTYYLLLHTSIPTVIAECGFLSNQEEAALLCTEEYQSKVAQALYQGIIKYLTDE